MGKEREGRQHARRDSAKPFRLVSKIVEGRKPVFGGAFNHLDSRHLDLFACVSGNRVSVYRCVYGEPTERVQVYVDQDETECFYTVTWLSGPDGEPLVVASGCSSVIRIIDLKAQSVSRSLVGHGGAVNELRAHPLEPELFVSASKDESLRLWNGAQGVCALVLGGARGHRNEVLSADFHPFDKAVVASCGMDSTIRIWSLHYWWSLVDLSKGWKRSDGKTGRSFPTQRVQYPIIIVQNVHTNYVDCLRWFGNFVLTKSVDSEVVLWRWCAKTDKSTPSEGVVDVVLTFPVPECDIWFLKFSLDATGSIMAVGNREGKLFVFDTASTEPGQIAQLSSKDCKASVRQTAVSYCGRMIMCCCDDGSVWRWDKANKDNAKNATQ